MAAPVAVAGSKVAGATVTVDAVRVGGRGCADADRTGVRTARGWGKEGGNRRVVRRRYDTGGVL